MISLKPGENYTLTWIGTDPFDSDNLYVRCVVRQITATGVTTIATVNLTDQGNHIFTHSYGIPGSVGTQLLFTYTVYTSSAYTDKSENYKEQSDHAVIEWRPGLFGQTLSGVHGGLTKKELLEALRQVFKEFPYPAQDTYDDAEVRRELERIMRAVHEIDIPEMPETDLTPVLAEVKASRNTIVEDQRAQTAKMMNAVSAYWVEMRNKLDTQQQETLQALGTELETIKDGLFHTQTILGEHSTSRDTNATTLQTTMQEALSTLSSRLDDLQRMVIQAVATQGKETDTGVEQLRKYFEDQQSFIRFMQSVAGVAQEEMHKPQQRTKLTI